MGDGQAVCVLSGGVDSTTAACLARRAVGDRLHCLVIDKGLEPDGEVERIRSLIGEGLGLEIRQINAAGRMMDQLRKAASRPNPSERPWRSSSATALRTRRRGWAGA